MDEDYLKIQGFKVKKSEANALLKIGDLIGRKIPIISEVSGDSFGAVIWFKQIIGLSLNGCNLEEIPSVIFGLPELRFLYLNNNNIREIPNQIKELTSLETLSLRGNKVLHIPTLPKSIRKIDISGNRLQGKIVLDYPNLLSINFSDNMVSSVEIVTNPRNIEVLDLSRNKIKTLSHSLHSASIQRLSLQKNEIERIDSWFPTQVKELNLSHNHLGPLIDFENCGRFEQLTELNLSVNGAEDLRLRTAQFPMLEVIRLTGNRFTHLPKSLLEFKSLRKIYAGANLINELQEEFCKKEGLEYIGLENNRISILPFWINEISAEVNLKKNPIKLI